MPTLTARERLKARRLVERYQAWHASFMRRGANRNEAHERAMEVIGVDWRELARAERIAAGAER